ncbi:hypothetical protein F2Q69_00063086 [Brassica cretica]|uniref:Uncharacterized protein n=1 Tax=Brassica cretica TaxID=69181 RepID=A0A8S9RNB0_BRACR|nr:hypothetical protein F2Q69_00063086 [Brassica cretica]
MNFNSNVRTSNLSTSSKCLQLDNSHDTAESRNSLPPNHVASDNSHNTAESRNNIRGSLTSSEDTSQGAKTRREQPISKNKASSETLHFSSIANKA